MTFTQAIESAPADADFVKYTDHTGVVIYITRSGFTWAGVAEATSKGAAIVDAGVLARECTLWDADKQQFVTAQEK